MSSLTLDSIYVDKFASQQIILDQSLQEEMYQHLKRGYPAEACGFLLGIYEEGHNKLITQIVPVKNLNEDQPEKQFEISPLDTLRVDRSAREQGLDILGIYHSHPDHPSRPSATDLQFALPGWSYFIYSIGSAYPELLTSWVLDDHKFIEQKIIITT